MPDSPKRFRPIGWSKPKDTRPSAGKRGYDYRWQKARKSYLAKHPLCVYCKKRGLVKAATCVDHIIPHKGDPVKFWDAENNWAASCKQCNDSKGDRTRMEAFGW